MSLDAPEGSNSKTSRLTAPDADPKALYLSVEPELTMAGLEAKMPQMPVELGGIFDPNGRLKRLPKLGDHRSIAWCRAEAGSLRDADVTHSHPGGGTFSESDLKMAAGHDLRSLRAISVHRRRRGYAYEIVRPRNGWPDCCSDPEFVAYVAGLMDRPEADVWESIEELRSMPDALSLRRAACMEKTFRAARQRASAALLADYEEERSDEPERSARSEFHLHRCLAQALGELGVEYRREEPDAHRP